MNPALLKKLVVGYILAVPVLLVLYVLQIMSIQSATNTHRRIASANQTIAAADALDGRLQDARKALNEYLTTNKSAHLTQYQSTTSKAREAMQQLILSTHGDHAEEARAQKVELAVKNRFDLFQQEIDLWTKQGPSPAQLGEMDAQGEKQMEAIRGSLGKIKKYESDHLPGWLGVAQAGIEKANTLSPISGVLGLWLVIVAALLMYRDAKQRSWRGIERRIQTGIVETLPFGVCLADEHGLIFFTNAAQDSLFGYEPGGMIGRHLTVLHNVPRAEGDDFFDEAMRQLAERGEWRGEFPGRKKNGTSFTCVSQAVTMELSGKSYRVFLTGSQARQTPASVNPPGLD